MSAIQVLTAELEEGFISKRRSLADYLFLETHPTLKRQWKVESGDPAFMGRMDGAISRFGTVSVWDYDTFVEAAAEQGYGVVFMDDPSDVFEWKASLTDAPGVAVESKLDGRLDRNGTPLRLVQGFLPFQAVGLNFMKSCERFVYFQWSTGTGKTLAAEGTILIKRTSGFGPTKADGFDLCLYVVSPNNLINSCKKLNQHTGLDARILKGTPKRRERLFAETAQKMAADEQPILIMNAEKFREDTEFFKLLVTDKNVLVLMDEMPEKYANRTSQLYRATAEVFYTSFTVQAPKKNGDKPKTIYYPHVGDDRTKGVFWAAMCATPLRNSPEDFFNSARMADSTIYGTINDFSNNFVARRDRWHQVAEWKNLDLFGAMAAHVVHQANKKTDPEIAAQFPAKLPPEIDYCDLNPTTEYLYGVLQAAYRNVGLSMLDLDEILAAIGVFQMILDNPRSVLDSALKYEAYEAKREAFMRDLHKEHITIVGNTHKGWKTQCSCGWVGTPDEDSLWGVEKEANDDCHSHIAEVIKSFEKKNREGSEVALKLVNLVNDDQKFTDVDSKGNCIVPKMLKLKERIDRHDGKVIVFSTKNETLIPYIAQWFEKWGITYVAYHGTLSAKQKQDAQDSFRNDPSIKVFLGSDAGKSSIDLPEADLTIHYNLPHTAATKEQRGNRQDRIDSDMDVVQEVELRVEDTVEVRKDEIIVTKQGYHDQIFGGVIAEQSDAMKITKADYFYILTGKRPGDDD